jgi:hypothetical protein
MRSMLILLVLTSAAAAAEEPQLPHVSSQFGVRVDPLRGGRAQHRGIDLPGAPGTPVLAAAPGTVRVAGRRGSYGELIELVHPDGSATRYAHLSVISVAVGQAVAQGEVIGRMGSTGRSTGSHLHFEYRIGGVPVDPLRYFGRERSGWKPGPGRPEPLSPQPLHRSQFSQRRASQAPPGPADLPDGRHALRSLGLQPESRGGSGN